MKSAVGKENPSRTPFLDRQVPPEKLELVWDNWRSQPENGSISPNDTRTANTATLASSSYENVSPTTLSSTKSAKRWALFGSKKIMPDTPTITVTPPQSESSSQRELTRQKSRFLKKPRSMCRTRSSADLKCHTPGQSDFGTAKCAPHIPKVPANPIEYSYVPPSPSLSSRDDVDTQYSGAALYFTVDPAWDESKGDAHLYFLPSPGVVIARDQGLRRNALKPAKTPHCMGTATTHNTRPPKNIKSVVGSDNQTSFLFIE